MRKAGLGFLVVLLLAGLVWQVQRWRDLPMSDPVDSPYLVGEEYERLRNIYTGLVGSDGSAAALNKLASDMKVSDRILANCHPFAHEIGHAAYLRYGSVLKALSFRDSLCNFGYVHGVIEEHFKSLDDVTAELGSVCGDPGIISFDTWQCFHGLGHGMMYFTVSDLPESITLCGNLEATFARNACVNGVFMENFGGGAVHASTFVGQDGPSYPCNEQAENDKAACYFYAPTYYLSLHPGDFAGAADWCRSAVSLSSACISGVGAEVMEANIDNFEAVRNTCASIGESQSSCINGAVNLLVFHQASIAKAGTFCDQTTGVHNSVCINALAGLREQFPELD